MANRGARSSIDQAETAFGALLLIASITAVFAPAAALAQPQGAVAGEGTESGAAARASGWYSGLSLGRSRIGISDSALPLTGVTTSSLSRDTSSTSFKVYGGYQFNRNFALEGGYTEFGKFDYRRDVAAPVFGSISSNLRASGLYLDAVGIVPLRNGFSLFGKLGTIYTMSKSSVSTSGAVAPLLTLTDLNPQRSEWNSKYGLGASYDLSNSLGLRFEYERVNNLGDFRTGEGNVGMWSLGLTKRY